ncbi:MAG: pyruvate:ferredoxin (flavodoxin) oxidoreductase [Planctomycetota bacterium]
MPSRVVTVDANEAVASVAHRLNEVIAIYPITPASPMGEHADEWAALARPNLWGLVPEIVEMQSEGGAAGAVHGALQAGALTTTFTASQGLLLMLPNLYKLAGELTACCLHVAARTVATHALSIFGDHSDVMACRQTGCALLAASSVQAAHDLACIAQLTSLRARVPFIHFFDGFRTSHEIAKIRELGDDDLRALIDEEDIAAHRRRALTPDRPVLRGTAQNPDAFFQAREAVNPYYQACPGHFDEACVRFAARTGRRYRAFEYVGHPEAERVVVSMGSGAETVAQTVLALVARGERVGALEVRLYRPFDVEAFAAALPQSVTRLAVLDRTKEPGATGEPLYLDVVAALAQTGRAVRAVGGRFGLSSKEFTPTHVASVLAELVRERPRHGFTVGIEDDVSHSSLAPGAALSLLGPDVTQALFYGLGSDGTVGSNKNTIKIIGEETDLHAQGYFVYDSKKAGAVTISHLRFGPRPLHAPYLIEQASFVACHQFNFLERFDVLALAAPGATFLLNAPFPPAELWDQLPREVQARIQGLGLKLYCIDAYAVAGEAGLGRRISTVMQTCFFALSGVLDRAEAIGRIKEAVEKSYGKKGREVVRRNEAAIDQALAHLHEVAVPQAAPTGAPRPPVVPAAAPELVQRVIAPLLAREGDALPVSAFPADGTWPTATSQWEKRGLAHEIPVWDEQVCIQCNKCALVCPHAAIRAKVVPEEALAGAPAGFVSTAWRGPDLEGQRYVLAVAPDDCTGCTLCVVVCPAKDKGNPRHKAIDMAPVAPRREQARADYAFFLDLPEVDRTQVKRDVKGSQLLQPLFEYSGACAGCGETPYIKLLTQLFGDRLLIANATGCSSIFGGNLPTTPYAQDDAGRGPAWSNSLFEDNAEFGLGFRLALDTQAREAAALVRVLASAIGPALAEALLVPPRRDEVFIQEQRARVERLRAALGRLEGPEARRLELLADYLVPKSVWLVGGDGWAYDIGFGGLDHVLASGKDVNVLVLDTEVYSNTGGQASKSTPLGAAAKFAAAGKAQPKKDLGLMAMSYGGVYVAKIAFGAKDAQTVKALQEAEDYPGPSLVIAYAHCIAHGYDLALGAQQQRLAVESGAWPLYRFDPRRLAEGLPPLQLDSKSPKLPLAAYTREEARFRMAQRIDPQRFERLLSAAQAESTRRAAIYQQLAGIHAPGPQDGQDGAHDGPEKEA